MEEMLKAIVMAMTMTMSVFAIITLLLVIISRLKEQKKLYSSIKLIELRHFKVHYMIFMGVAVGLLLYLIGQTLDSASPEHKFFVKNLGFSRGEFIMVSIFVEILLLTVSVYYAVLALSKSAVLDKGIYTGFGFIEWNEIYDYVINEKTGRVVFTVNREAFSSMRGTTPPYRVFPEDVSKLRFILNKNKNQFNE